MSPSENKVIIIISDDGESNYRAVECTGAAWWVTLKTLLMGGSISILRAISTVFHNYNPFIEFSNFLTSVVEFNGEFENKKKQ